MNQKILIIGGDVRQLEVAKLLFAKGKDITLVGFEQHPEHTIINEKISLQEIEFHTMDAILVPVSGIDQQGKIKAPFAEQELALTHDQVNKTPKHCVIYTGVQTSYLQDLVAKTERKLVPLFERDDVAILNSIPTAEGTLQLAMEQTDFMIHGSKVMVLGYGRVGKTLARVFAGVGAHVYVSARKEADFARISEIGLTPCHLNNLEQDLSDVDICINTIPHMVLTSSVLANLPRHALVIDVASKPGGTDFEFAKQHGINTVWALGLPGKVAPKSAGQIIGNVLLELLS
ncbi:dipicolinate synthase subunit DpsA [Mesobacillus maritimus]|uniref:dipicolinate synthase subunit DpsA n=1 Tax=Mesobacillus maritimus TaxID=1643336 RepID=UPI00203DEEA9|nr:dipicolinate synthase subunit DpsA [Mesobacillus maritimus]MCM3586597.1 dipicolinate synthase subunit DpsA [Mesobacillus maritimus]